MQTFSSSRKSSERVFAAQQRFTFGKSAEDFVAPRRYRAAWISDAHLEYARLQRRCAARFSARERFLIRSHIVGDLIDIWSLRRGIYWPQQHNDVIQKFCAKLARGTHVIYIPGNHDELVTDFCGAYGNIEIKQRSDSSDACWGTQF